MICWAFCFAVGYILAGALWTFEGPNALDTCRRRLLFALLVFTCVWLVRIVVVMVCLLTCTDCSA